MNKNSKKKTLSHFLNIITIALIVECFLCAMMAVNMYAKENCIERIEENTTQVSHMLKHSMDERMDKLNVFADILAANSENPEELLQTYMENFCITQDFSGMCIHRANGSHISFGHPNHIEKAVADFDAEVTKLPYVSDVLSHGNSPANNYIYQAVPIIRNEKTIAVLYGYMTLDVMPSFISSTAYSGNCEFYVIDGDSGGFLMDEYHGMLGNIYNGSMGDRTVKHGYYVDDMINDIRNGRSGDIVFKPEKTDNWHYTYYMPIGINNWSVQMTVDEPIAFAAYDNISNAMLILMICVIILMIIHILALMFQNSLVAKRDKERLHKSKYISAVQRELINAHNNPDFVDKALKIIADEMKAETVLLLSFADKIVASTYYWPSKDKAQAMNLVGRNIRDDFPMLFDSLLSSNGVVYDREGAIEISDTAKLVFEYMDVQNMALVPITDTAGSLRGAIAAVNMAEKQSTEMLECVTYDFFMALTNLENHTIIKNMGEMDYLTGIKNRNSYESNIVGYITMECDSLWCMFIDVNGLHEVNNTQGHKAGDVMLCTVADAIKRAFGENHTYRLGGDEFIAFVADSSQEELLKKKKIIAAELAVRGYYVSIGFEGEDKNDNGMFNVERIVAEAEAHMYREKHAFYEKNNISDDRGHFPKPTM